MGDLFQRLERQRRGLSHLGGLLLTAMCVSLALVSATESGEGLQFQLEGRWPTIVGLVGLVLLFVLYQQKKHREFAALEARMRELAVREATLQARFSELSFLFDTSTQLQLRLDLKSMLELAAQRLVPCLDAHQSSIMLFDAEKGVLEVRAASGVSAEHVLGAKVAPGEGIAGHVYSTGETLVLTPEVMKKRFPSELKKARSIGSALCVPMRFRGKAIGVVSVTRTSGELFGESHARILESFAEHCAAAVLKTHHHQELLGRHDRAA
jgi:transcriptional regulator with GAF, ATPase, and Fis domain